MIKIIPAMSRLSIRNVSKSYFSRKKSLLALSSANLDIGEGEFICLVGPSGCGKTTLLNMIAGLIKSDTGSISYDGEIISGPGPDRTVVFQDFALFPLLTALENIEYPMELCRVEAQEAERQARELARRVSLPEELLDRYPTHISGGEQQRVAIARGLTMDRRLLLADEPTGNLDSENSDNIIDLLLRLAHEENRCVIVVTHDLSVMDRADVVYRISDGLLQRR